ncbi:MAG: group II intron maturase-specific domain-containing protein [Planctomycetota bacterium]
MRRHGASLQWIIADCNRTLPGWYGYFKENQRLSLFKSLDGWIRRRLRNILRLRSGRRGPGKVVIIKSGRTSSLLHRGCSFCCRPVCRSLNPHEGEPSIGEPCAGNPPARFGGRGGPGK